MKMNNRTKTNVSTFLVLGIFMGIVVSFPAVGDDTDTDWTRNDEYGWIYPYNLTDKVGIGTQEPTSLLHVNGAVTYQGGSTLTISSGQITVTHSFHSVLGSNLGRTTNITKITAAPSSGQIVFLGISSTSYPVTFKDRVSGSDNLLLASDFNIDGDGDMITLLSVNTNWVELSRSNNG
jgi:hypothetical protein